MYLKRLQKALFYSNDMNTEPKRNLDILKDDLDSYGQLALKTITTVSMGACAFTLTSIGAVFASIYPQNPELALKAIVLIDGAFDDFLRAAICSIIAIITTFASYLAMAIQQATNSKRIAESIVVITGLGSLLLAFAAAIFCVIGFVSMLNGIEQLSAIFTETKKT